jgi:hypothetical protein
MLQMFHCPIVLFPHTYHCVLGTAQNKEMTVLKYTCLIKSSLAEQPQNLACSVHFIVSE